MVSFKNIIASKTVLICTIPILLLTSSCVRYQAEPLKSLSYARGASTKESLSLIYKVLDGDEQMKYLGRKFNSISMHNRQAFTPVQVTISNLTPHAYKLPEDAFSVDVVSVSDVYENVKTSTAGRFLLVGVPSYAVGAYVGIIAVAAALFSFPVTAAIFGIAALGSFVTGTRAVQSSARSNSALDADYAEKSLENGRILPDTVVNGVIFVKRGTFKEYFSIKLLREPTGAVSVIKALPAMPSSSHS
ncbi:MAG: hypothetical protein S4CHLAM37_02190 [Chlamydiia bacterium]|nr:hypothetical protein [Chlamydiia bacterium]